MKRIFTLLFFLCCCVQINFAQSQKTFVKSLSMQQASTLSIQLDGAIEILEWDQSFVRVTSTIELANFNEEILKRLVAVGRYSLTSNTANGVMTITMPKLATPVTIKGQALKEILSYQVYIPKGITVETNNKTPQDTIN